MRPYCSDTRIIYARNLVQLRLCELSLGIAAAPRQQRHISSDSDLRVAGEICCPFFLCQFLVACGGAPEILCEMAEQMAECAGDASSQREERVETEVA